VGNWRGAIRRSAARRRGPQVRRRPRRGHRLRPPLPLPAAVRVFVVLRSSLPFQHTRTHTLSSRSVSRLVAADHVQESAEQTIFPAQEPARRRQQRQGCQRGERTSERSAECGRLPSFSPFSLAGGRIGVVVDDVDARAHALVEGGVARRNVLPLARARESTLLPFPRTPSAGR